MLEILLHTIKDRVQLAVRRECGDTGRHRFNTSDVVQESLIQIWMSLSENQIQQLLECNSWLRKIALGHRAKLKRKHLAKKRSINFEVQAHDNLISHTPNGDQQAEHLEQVNLVMQEVEHLGELDKQIVVRYIFRDQSFLLIASKINRNAQFVRRRYRNAIKLLRQRLAEKGIEFDE